MTAAVATDTTVRLRSASPLTTARQTHTVAGRTTTTARTAATWLTGPAATATARAYRAARDAVLVLGGIALVAVAGWLLHPAAGLAAAGIGLLALQQALRPDGLVVPIERLVVMLAAARTGMTDTEILAEVGYQLDGEA